MFSRFRAAFSRVMGQPAPQQVSVYVSGVLYTRDGEDVHVYYADSHTSEIISAFGESDHTAPNGVRILAIAYALALIEGMIVIGTARARDMPAVYPAHNGPN